MTGSRYKREAEERVTEIQELVRAKDRSQESCQNEKTELHNRIKSLNQQYSMVQSQYKETEADFIKLKQDVDTMKLQHAQADSAHAAEYEKLKQEKDNDIAKLKDDVADLTRQNQNLESSITSLQQKVKESENAYRQLLEQNSLLQQKLQNQPPIIAQPKLPNQAQPQDNHLSPGQNQAEHQGLAGDHKILQPNLDQILADANKQAQGQSALHTEAVHEGLRPVVDDSLNAQHQMRPPNNNINLDNDDGKKGYKDVNLHNDVNPNDEQKAQILGPALDANDKHPGGGEVDIVNMNIKHDDEDDRDKNEREDDAENVHHNNPLALGQIAMPRGDKELQDAAGQNKKDEQQVPPLVNDENDQKEQERGENHYFGEDEEAQQQQEEEQQRRQQQEDERQRMEEDEGDEGDHRFRDDIGNEDNKEAALADANN
ncbi:hypothetical protein BsWGS_26805 [Bradybaena similaris]